MFGACPNLYTPHFVSSILFFFPRPGPMFLDPRPGHLIIERRAGARSEGERILEAGVAVVHIPGSASHINHEQGPPRVYLD